MKKMFVFYFLVLAMFNFSAPVTPEMLIDKEIFSGLNSFLVAIFSICIFLTSPIAGKYINNNGLKRVMIIAPVVMALGQVVMLISPGSIGLLLGKGITGVGGAFFFLGGSIYVNYHSPPERKAKNFAYLMVTMSLGGVVGQVIIGNLSNYFDGYAYAFILQFIFSILLIFVGMYALKEIEITKKDDDKVKEKFVLTPMLLLVSVLAASFIIYAGNIGYYAMDQLGATTSQVGIINSLYLVIMLISNLFIIQHVEKYLTHNKSYFLQIGVALIAMIMLVIFIVTNHGGLIFLSLAIFIFSLSMFLPLAQKHIVTSSKNSNLELGYINSSYSLGMVFGSVIGGIAYAISPNLIFILIIVLLAIALIVHVIEIRKKV